VEVGVLPAAGNEKRPQPSGEAGKGSSSSGLMRAERNDRIR
jgi:hypothetical protein